MKQYCRYCGYAEDYNGEGTDFLCLADAPCGDEGNGQFYRAEKAKRENHCPHFSFNENEAPVDFNDDVHGDSGIPEGFFVHDGCPLLV